MSILWCGGEDVDFPNGTGVQLQTSSSYHDTSRTRCGIAPSSYGFMKGVQFGGGVTSCWLHAYLGVSTTYTTPLLIGLHQLSDNKGICISTPTTGGKLELRKYDGSSYTSLAAESGASLNAAKHTLDLYLSGIGAGSQAKLYLDGNLVIDFTGDLSVSGLTGFDSVFFLGRNSTYGVVSYVSQVIIADEDARAMSLMTLYPNGAGDVNTFDSGTYAEVDEITLSDSDIMSSGTAAQAAQLALSNLPAGTFTVKAVKIAARAIRGSSGITTLKLGVKSGGSIDVDAGQDPGTAWSTVERLMTENPVTSTGFLQSEIDPLQIAFGTAA